MINIIPPFRYFVVCPDKKDRDHGSIITDNLHEAAYYLTGQCGIYAMYLEYYRSKIDVHYYIDGRNLKDLYYDYHVKTRHRSVEFKTYIKTYNELAGIINKLITDHKPQGNKKTCIKLEDLYINQVPLYDRYENILSADHYKCEADYDMDRLVYMRWPEDMTIMVNGGAQ